MHLVWLAASATILVLAILTAYLVHRRRFEGGHP
jgi:heme exporter protein D